jgi:hypothetical protein
VPPWQPKNLHIIGIKVDWPRVAEDAVDQLDAKVDSGEVTIREVAIVYKTARSRLPTCIRMRC